MNILLIKENLADVQNELNSQLLRLHVSEKDRLRAQLLVEEISLRMMNYGRATHVIINVDKKFFGKVQIRLTTDSPSYNPLIEIADWNEDDEDYYTMMILKANRQRLNWLRKNNHNVVTINVRGESNRQLKLLSASIICGVICGFVMKTALSPETIALVTENFITPINTMFMNALSMVIAPVIFFSVISGITSMNKGAGVGKIGIKLIGMYMSTSIIAVIIGLITAWLLFSGDVPQIGTIPGNDKELSTYEFSLINFIVGIIPQNLISPVVNGNMLQIIFLSVLFGSCLNTIGDKVSCLQELMRNLNDFFMKVVGVIIIFVPLIAFLAMFNLVINTGFDIMLMMGKVIVGQLIASVLMLGAYMIIIVFVGKISPLPFAKKNPELWPVPFATSSSAVTMPFTMKFCTEKLGISPKITSFAIPIGTTINMDGACIYLVLAVVMFLRVYGIEIDWNAMFIIFTMTLSISVGSPAVPNASVIAILTIVATFGVPNDIAGVLFCLGAIGERINTCFNVTGNTAAALILARTENLVNKKIYFGNSVVD